LFVSDELAHGCTVLGELFHELILSMPTGKPGRPRYAERAVDADLDYATVHKTHPGAQVGKIGRKVVHGTEGQHILERLAKSSSRTIKTEHIERSNLEWRLWDAHLACKAPTVARSSAG
jgi:hypothetical protein